MPQINTAYDTLACRGFMMHKVDEAVKRLEITGSYGYSMTDDYGLCHVVYDLNSNEAIPAFVHPVLWIDGDAPENMPKAVVDCRPYVRYEARSGETVVKNLTDYKATLLYGNLANVWFNGKRRQLRDAGVCATVAFSRWLSENIARRFSITPREQLDLAILAAIYYQCLFTQDSDGKLSERDLNGMVATVARAVRVQATEVFSFIDRLNLTLPFSGIEDFCGLCYEATGSTRLQGFNAGTLFHIVRGTWFGANSEEITTVALEYPPAFLMLIITAMTEKTYRNSGIWKITENISPQDSKGLIATIGHLLETA